MNIYTLVAYRPNGADFASGQCWGSTDSDLAMYSTVCQEKLVAQWAKLIFENHKTKAKREYCDYSFALLVNGRVAEDLLEDCQIDVDPDLFDLVPEDNNLHDIASGLRAQASIEAKALFDLYQAEEAEKARLLVEGKLQQQRERDLLELNRLKQKLGIGE